MSLLLTSQNDGIDPKINDARAQGFPCANARAAISRTTASGLRDLASYNLVFHGNCNNLVIAAHQHFHEQVGNKRVPLVMTYFPGAERLRHMLNDEHIIYTPI